MQTIPHKEIHFNFYQQPISTKYSKRKMEGNWKKTYASDNNQKNI